MSVECIERIEELIDDYLKSTKARVSKDGKSENFLPIKVRQKDGRGYYLEFVVSTEDKNLKNEIKTFGKQQNGMVFGILCKRDGKYSVYVGMPVTIDKYGVFDIPDMKDINLDKLKKYMTKGFSRGSGKGSTRIEGILEFLKKNHKNIEGASNEELRDYFKTLVDIPSRVREGGILISSYIRYLEILSKTEEYTEILNDEERKLENVVEGGWSKLILQLFTMYYLTKRGRDGGIDNLKFDVIDAVLSGNDFSIDGYELWGMLKGDLERYTEIIRDCIFCVDDYNKLKENGIKLRNSVFAGIEKYEYIDPPPKDGFTDDKKGKGSDERVKSYWSRYEKIGILPLFEMRKWYDQRLIGDIIGGVYEGIQDIIKSSSSRSNKTTTERKSKGIYYTPRFIVEYIVNNTLDPYLNDWVKSKGDYESVDEFLKKASESELREFYEKLCSLRILDPACGTGHFLIYAMEKLVEYYLKVWNRVKAEEMQGFTVKVIERDSITEQELGELDEEVVPFVVKEHLILKNNIYGVDIDDYAHRIAKARMLIEVFENYNIKVKEAGYKFPSLEMNIKTGNSLIGFASWKEVPGERRRTLFDFEGGPTRIDEIKELMDKVKRTGNQKEYEKNMEKLRDKVNDAFVEYLAESGVKIEKEKLGYGEGGLRAFHWIIEFPEVFEGKNPGFDLVVGNPPYVNIKEINKQHPLLKIALPQLYYSAVGLYDILVVFIERSIYLLRPYGFFGFVVSNKFTVTDYGYNIRDLILRETRLDTLIDISSLKPFGDVSTYPIIIIFQISSPSEEDIVKIARPQKIDFLNDKSIYATISIEKYINDPKHIFAIESEEVDEIIKYTGSQGRVMRDMATLHSGTTGFEYENWGELIHSWDEISGRIHNDWTLFLVTGNIDRYLIDINKKIKYQKKNISRPVLFYDKRITEGKWWLFNTKKIVIRGMSKRLSAAIDFIGSALGVGVYAITHTHIDDKYILLLLNSKLFDFYYKKKFLSKHLAQGYIGYNKGQLEELPVKDLTESESLKRRFIIISEYLIYIYSHLTTLERLIKDLGIYFDSTITDSIVYELYFREKFHEDGLYPEPKNYLLEAVAKHLKPIEYDRWAELYWKKQIEGELSDEEERELEKLEEENLKTIEEVYEALRNDEEVQEWIEKIKSHEWVRVIEGEENDL